MCAASLNKTVCAGAVSALSPFILNSFFEGVFSPDYLCSQIGVCPDPQYERLYFQDFVDTVLATKPKNLDSDECLNELYSII